MANQPPEFIPLTTLYRVLYVDKIITDPFKESFSRNLIRFSPGEGSSASPAHYAKFVLLRFEREPIHNRLPPVNECHNLLHNFSFLPVDSFVPREPPPDVVHAYQLCPENRIDRAPTVERIFVLAFAWDNFARNADRSSAYVLKL